MTTSSCLSDGWPDTVLVLPRSVSTHHAWTVQAAFACPSWPKRVENLLRREPQRRKKLLLPEKAPKRSSPFLNPKRRLTRRTAPMGPAALVLVHPVLNQKVTIKYLNFCIKIVILGSNYCPIHGSSSTHPWDKCHLNKEGSNFNPDKAVSWANNLKKKSENWSYVLQLHWRTYQTTHFQNVHSSIYL